MNHEIRWNQEYFNSTMAKPFKWTYGQQPLHV
jgi:hypothetical protein